MSENPSTSTSNEDSTPDPALYFVDGMRRPYMGPEATDIFGVLRTDLPTEEITLTTTVEQAQWLRDFAVGSESELNDVILSLIDDVITTLNRLNFNPDGSPKDDEDDEDSFSDGLTEVLNNIFGSSGMEINSARRISEEEARTIYGDFNRTAAEIAHDEDDLEDYDDESPMPTLIVNKTHDGTTIVEVAHGADAS